MSRNWQRFKNHGQPIYEADIVGNMVHLRRIKRVIHHSKQFEKMTTFSVRYKNRWHPLHAADELKSEMTTPNGPLKVYLGGQRLNNTDDRLPFLCKWEEPGYHYEVFGY